MKKSLLAVAVAAALPALAHAQSSVTMYGIVDASVEYSDDQSNATLATSATGAQTITTGESGFRVNSGTQSGSRFGIRGVEDLGGGLQAVFTLEHGFDVSTGETANGLLANNNTRFWNRQLFVGLNSASWGQLTAGRQYTPLFWALLPADFAGYTFYNNWAAVTGTNVGAVANVQGPFRVDNSLAYKSPTFGGLTVYAMYAFGENLQNEAAPTGGKTLAGTGDVAGIAAGWQLGGLYLTAGYHSVDSKAWSGNALATRSVLAAAASYKFSNFGLSLGYTEVEYQQFAGGVVGEPKLSNVLISAFANLGPGTLIVNAVMNDVSGARVATSATTSVDSRNDSALQLGVAYTMPLSKRTNWYVAYGLNDASPLQSSVAGTQLIDSQNRISIGMRHLF
jgi:predicted porin